MVKTDCWLLSSPRIMDLPYIMGNGNKDFLFTEVSLHWITLTVDFFLACDVAGAVVVTALLLDIDPEQHLSGWIQTGALQHLQLG